MTKEYIRHKLIRFVHQRSRALKAVEVKYGRKPKMGELIAIQELINHLAAHRDHGLQAHVAMVCHHKDHLRAIMPSERSRQKSWRKKIEDIICFCTEHYRQVVAA